MHYRSPAPVIDVEPGPDALECLVESLCPWSDDELQRLASALQDRQPLAILELLERPGVDAGKA